MKLGRLEVLMARLALAIPSHQFHELVFQCSQLSEAQKAEIKTPIKLLFFLKARFPTVDGFLRSLENHFDGVENFKPLSDILQAFRAETPSGAPAATMTSLSFQSISSSPPAAARSFWFKPQRDQQLHFRKSLLNISNSLSQSHLDVMVALSPIPETAKEKVAKGYQLFEELKRYGCIGENDTELLDQFFTLLNLHRPQELLQTYQQLYPAVIDHSDPPPSAPLIRSHSVPWPQSGQSPHPPATMSPYGDPSYLSIGTLPPSSFPYQQQHSTPSPSYPSPIHPSPSHPPPTHPPPSHPPPSHPPPTSTSNGHLPSPTHPPSSPGHHQPVSPPHMHTVSQSSTTRSHSHAPIPETQTGGTHHYHGNQTQGYSVKWVIPSTNFPPPSGEDAFARPAVSQHTTKTQDQHGQAYPRPFSIASPQNRPQRKRTRDESSEAGGGMSEGDQSPSAPEKHPRHSKPPAAVSPDPQTSAPAPPSTEGQHTSPSPLNTRTTAVNANQPYPSSSSSMTPRSSSRFAPRASEEEGCLVRNEVIVAGRLPHPLSPTLSQKCSPQEEEQHLSPTKFVGGNRSWNVRQQGSSHHHSNELRHSNRPSHSPSHGDPTRSTGYDLRSGQVGSSETASGKPFN